MGIWGGKSGFGGENQDLGGFKGDFGGIKMGIWEGLGKDLEMQSWIWELGDYCEAHACEDPLLTPVPTSENPFRFWGSPRSR
uniref:G protein gamma domain-containing protein n=1 Tax=Cyanistes caeruleus TaxID=156563 RepID=A0A8C0UCH0_CYACU